MLNKTDLEFPEIGFMIPKKFWGQGITFEVGKLLMIHAFDHLGVLGFSARVDYQNQASVRVLEKLGLHFVEAKNNDQGDLIKIFRLKK